MKTASIIALHLALSSCISLEHESTRLQVSGRTSLAEARTVAPKTDSSYTYTDAISAEEVTVTAATLDLEIGNRLAAANPELQLIIAYAAEMSDDEILCDLLATRVLIQQEPTLDITIAAIQAQIACLQIGNNRRRSL